MFALTSVLALRFDAGVARAVVPALSPLPFFVLSWQFALAWIEKTNGHPRAAAIRLGLSSGVTMAIVSAFLWFAGAFHAS